MDELRQKFAGVGVGIPEILLPEKTVDMGSWAVIACDQFSSEKEYWEDVKTVVGDHPSTLNLIFPECYLEEKDLETEVTSINSVMRAYLEEGLLETQKPGFVLVERKVKGFPPRTGIVLSLDLEHYDFSEGSTSLIRPTEGTIISRLPPRMKIREDAALDLPHILVLIDDPEGSVIEKAAEKNDVMEVLYDFDLMKDGGHVTGWMVDDPGILEGIASALEKLAGKRDLLFAVGDGNHSLAAAKSIWEQVKQEGGSGVMDHPARWALVEVENIYDPGVVFEPIHRVLFGADPEDLLDFIKEKTSCTAREVSDSADPADSIPGESGVHAIGFAASSKRGVLSIERTGTTLAAEVLQDLLDSYMEQHRDVGIDFIHGEDSLLELGKQSGNIGFLLPPLDKGSFFPTIQEKGSFPRKTFSIGEAWGKRYYIEARRLKPV